MYTVLWREGPDDHWDRIEEASKVLDLLFELKENPDVCEYDIWVFEPKADMFALDYNMFFSSIGADSDDDPRLTRLKLALCQAGNSAVSAFIGEAVPNMDANSFKTLIPALCEKIENSYYQMPEEELNKFLEQYEIK